MVASIDKIETSPELPPGCSLENWHDAIRLREAYGWRKDIDCWVPFSESEPSGIWQPGDMVAVSARGFIKPRQLAVIGKTDGSLGIPCVYLGLLPPLEESDAFADGGALFCDCIADSRTLHKLPLLTVPLTKIAYVARVIGAVAIGKPFRDLQAWQFAEHERALVEKLESEMSVLIRLPLQVFDNGMPQKPLPPRIEGGNSVH